MVRNVNSVCGDEDFALHLQTWFTLFEVKKIIIISGKHFLESFFAELTFHRDMV